jgi:hypothetical protein
MIEDLIHLWFTHEEARIYIACLEVWTAPISAIARRTDTKRQTCLYTIKKLIEKWFISSIEKDGNTYYIPENPEILRKNITLQLEKTNIIIPELLSITNTLTQKPRIRFYEGRNLDKILSELHKETYVRAITNLDMAILHRKEELIRFREERKLNPEIHTQVITYNTQRVQNFLGVFGIPLGDEYRYIKLGDFEIQNDIIILKDKVLILSIPQETSSAIVIEWISFVQTQQAIFETLWRISNPI